MKIKKLFLVLGVILFSLVISGCTSVSYLKEGTYVSNNNIENGDFKKAKYIISKIDKETFDSHNGVNVFIDAASSSNNPKYLLIELYLFSNATSKFELVTLSNIKHMGGTTNQYTMDAFLKIDDKEYNGQITFNTGYFEIFNFAGSFIHESNKIIEGEYETAENIGKTQISKSKLIIKEISKEEYELKNSNVFIGLYDNQYINIELYIFDDEVNDYISTTIQNISYQTYKYIGDIEFVFNEQIVKSRIMITFDEEIIIEIEGYLGHKYNKIGR
jgi:hypothetical protein